MNNIYNTIAFAFILFVLFCFVLTILFVYISLALNHLQNKITFQTTQK